MTALQYHSHLAYLNFFKSNYTKLSKNSDDITAEKLTKLVSERWSSLSH
jgi:hypothetical protein